MGLVYFKKEATESTPQHSKEGLHEDPAEGNQLGLQVKSRHSPGTESSTP
jgi:hypothetical protein